MASEVEAIWAEAVAADEVPSPRGFLGSSFEIFWRYRFFHREMYDLRRNDPVLAKLWRRHVDRSTSLLVRVYRRWVEAGMVTSPRAATSRRPLARHNRGEQLLSILRGPRAGRRCRADTAGRRLRLEADAGQCPGQQKVTGVAMLPKDAGRRELFVRPTIVERDLFPCLDGSKCPDEDDVPKQDEEAFGSKE